MSNYVIKNGELFHWGIPGMKWGVRKQREPQGPDTRSEDQIKFDTLRQKKFSQMSQNELRFYLDRMDLERRYNQAHPSDHEQAKRFIKNAVSDVKTGIEVYQTVRSVIDIMDGGTGDGWKNKKKKKK